MAGAKKFQKYVHQTPILAQENNKYNKTNKNNNKNKKNATQRTNETKRTEHTYYEHEHYLHKITLKSQNMIQNINRL